MKLSRDQELAVKELSSFLGSGRKLFKLHGPAGSGKSETISRVLSNRADVRYSAPTNKATQVLVSKGTEAQTVYSLMYQPVEVIDHVTKKPKLIFKENPKSPLWSGGTLVIDEAAMTPNWMSEQLMQYPIQVVAVGDPYQLPPVKSSGSIASGDPDALLTQVHRQQGEGSNVLELATHVRERGRLPGVFNRGSSRIVKNTLEAGDLLDYDAVIVGTHKTRFKANAHLRKLRGYKGLMPNKGETILCKTTDLKKGLINGCTYTVRGAIDSGPDTVYLELEDELGNRVAASSWKYGFTGPEGLEKLERMSMKDRKEHGIFWHGEAITCHSSQGSEYDRVLVVDESRVFRGNASKWIYTAVSRAKKSVTVVRS